MKWQNDPDFVSWILRSKYAKRGPKGKIEPYISDGLVLYCHEAWTVGKNHGVADATLGLLADGLEPQQVIDAAALGRRPGEG